MLPYAGKYEIATIATITTDNPFDSFMFSQAIKNSETMNRNLGWFEGRMERQIWDGV